MTYHIAYHFHRADLARNFVRSPKRHRDSEHVRPSGGFELVHFIESPLGEKRYRALSDIEMLPSELLDGGNFGIDGPLGARRSEAG